MSFLRYAVIVCTISVCQAQFAFPPAGGGGGGSGTVTSVATGCGTSGGTITTTGTIIASELVRAVTGTSDIILDSDCGKLVTFTNASPIAETLPQANGSTFVSGWFVKMQNRGAGTVTITPTTSTIDGAASITLLTADGVEIHSDGTNYFTVRGRLRTILGAEVPNNSANAGLAATVTSIASHASTELSDSPLLARLAGPVFSGAPSLPAGSILGGVTLSGLTGPIYMTAGVPRITTGTCNSSTFVVGDGSCAAISTAYTVISGVPANSLLGNNTGATANAISLTALPFINGLAKGGTHADLSATGGTSQVLKQVSVGADVTVGQLACADLSNASAACSSLTNLTLVSPILGTPQSGTLTNATGLPAAGVVGTAAVLNGNNIFTANGALSSGAGPGETHNGIWITGGSATTTKPYFLIETTGATSTAWSTNGTGLGINAASGFTGNMLDVQINGSSSFSVNSAGVVTVPGTLVAGVLNRAVANVSLIINNSSYATANRFSVTMASGTMSQTSGSNGAVAITPTYNQASGGADNIDLKINRTETAVGSGAQKFLSLQVGAVEKFNVDHLGDVTVVPQASSTGQRYVCIDTTGKLVSSAAACVGT